MKFEKFVDSGHPPLTHHWTNGSYKLYDLSPVPDSPSVGLLSIFSNLFRPHLTVTDNLGEALEHIPIGHCAVYGE